MKHSWKITFVLLAMFFVTQLIGLAVLQAYSPEIIQTTNDAGEVINFTTHSLPYGAEPPQDTDPTINLLSIVFAIVIAVGIMFLLMRYNAALFLRLWFFIVVIFALALTFNAGLKGLPYASIMALIIALPLAFFKVFKRNMLVHNFTELLIYPGIAALFVPLLNVGVVVILLILISIYDAYAVWHSGFMQRMAKYQIEQVRVFSGFFVPYLGKKDKAKIAKAKTSKTKNKKVKLNVAILGGGDVIFPLILAGTVLRSLGLTQAIIIAIGSTLALAALFYYSEKGKFYPAMPFITAGSFLGLLVAYLI